MTIKRLACLVLATMSLGASSAQAQSDWADTGTDHLPPDRTVPYLPAVPPLICPNGEHACLGALATELGTRTNALGCDHAAVFSDAYLAITQALQDATATPGFFDRPDRINHEARTYAQEYFDQYDRWHAGAPSGSASPAWEVAFRATTPPVRDRARRSDAGAQRAHSPRQSDPRRRADRRRPADTGRHARCVRQAGSRAGERGAPPRDDDDAHAARRRQYDPTLDDGASLLDPHPMYSIIAAWREESWRNAEQLRHARALAEPREALSSQARPDRGHGEGGRRRDPRSHAHRPAAQHRAQRLLRRPRVAVPPADGRCTNPLRDEPVRFDRRAPSRSGARSRVSWLTPTSSDGRGPGGGRAQRADGAVADSTPPASGQASGVAGGARR